MLCYVLGIGFWSFSNHLFVTVAANPILRYNFGE